MRYLRQTVALFALGFLGLYYGWDVVRDPKATATRSEPQVAGGVARVRRAPISRQLQLEGTLLPMAQTQVVAPIAGQLIELRFKTGDFVAAGAVVGAIASADLATRLTGQQASVDAARQSLQATEDELQAATLRLTHYQELVARDLIARHEVEERAVARETARAQAELREPMSLSRRRSSASFR